VMPRACHPPRRWAGRVPHVRARQTSDVAWTSALCVAPSVRRAQRQTSRAQGARAWAGTSSPCGARNDALCCSVARVTKRVLATASADRRWPSLLVCLLVCLFVRALACLLACLLACSGACLFACLFRLRLGSLGRSAQPSQACLRARPRTVSTVDKHVCANAYSHVQEGLYRRSGPVRVSGRIGLRPSGTGPKWDRA
jgi:hypothetical protein